MSRIIFGTPPPLRDAACIGAWRSSTSMLQLRSNLVSVPVGIGTVAPHRVIPHPQRVARRENTSPAATALDARG